MLSIGPVFFPVVSAASVLGFFHPMDAHRRFQSFYFVQLIFFVYTYSVCFFGRMLASMYFAALVFRTKFFFCTSWGLLSSVSVIAVLTLFIMFICLLLKNSAGCPMHIYYSP